MKGCLKQTPNTLRSRRRRPACPAPHHRTPTRWWGASPSPPYRCARDPMLGALGTNSSKWSPEGNPTTPCHSFEGPLGDTMGLRDSWEPHGCQKLKVTGWPWRTSDNRKWTSVKGRQTVPFPRGKGDLETRAGLSRAHTTCTATLYCRGQSRALPADLGGSLPRRGPCSPCESRCSQDGRLHTEFLRHVYPTK